MNKTLKYFVVLFAKILFYGSLFVMLLCFATTVFINSTNFEFADDGDSFDMFMVYALPTCIILTISGMFMKQPFRIGDWGALRILGTLILSALVFISFIFTIGFDMCVTSYSAPLFELKSDRSVRIVKTDFGCGATDSTPSTKSFVKVEEYPFGLIYVTPRIDTTKMDKTKWIRMMTDFQRRNN